MLKMRNLKKTEAFVTDCHFDTANEVFIIKWKANKVVTLGTNFSTVYSVASI